MAQKDAIRTISVEPHNVLPNNRTKIRREFGKKQDKTPESTGRLYCQYGSIVCDLSNNYVVTHEN